MKKALDYVSDYQRKSACKDVICIAPSKVTQMIFAVLENWCHHIVLTHSCKLVSFLRAKAALLSARLSHRNSVCLSVRPSVWHTCGSGKNGPSWDHQIFTIGCLEDSSFRNRKAFA